jgi:hypothetical protein
VPAHPPWQSIDIVSAKRGASQTWDSDRISTLFVAQFGNVDASRKIKQPKSELAPLAIILIAAGSEARKDEPTALNERL